MPKRRRERDKPKTGPESLYNPNKRVLLSYASDEEEVTLDDAAQQTSVNGAEAATCIDDRSLANYQMTEYPDSGDDSIVGRAVDGSSGASARKEEVDDDDEHAMDDVKDVVDIEEGVSSTTQDKVINDRGPPVKRDPATHQWPTLGPVSYGEVEEDDDDEYDPETEEAMAYLRAVKYERQTIPEILSAPRQFQADADHLQDNNPNERQVEDDEGESAAVSDQIETLESDSTPADDDATNPQKVFTRLLIERFMEQRKQLHSPPSIHTLAELPDSCPISFPRGNNKAFSEWFRLLSTKPPLPAQLRSMDQATIFNLIGLVQMHYLTKNCKLSKITSAWIWSLLARLDDVGTMNNDEVFPLRELGKKVVFLLLSFTSPELATGLEDLGQEALSITSAEANKTQQSASTTPPTENTLATLDMILVVIGEAFGQKDLLEFRPTWTATEKPV